MTPGWIPDRPTKCQKHVQRIMPNLLGNNLWLPSELLQVTPQTPNDHHQNSKRAQQFLKHDQHMSQTCSKIRHRYYENMFQYLWIIHRSLRLFMDNPEVSMDYPWKFEKHFVCFSQLPLSAFSQENAIFFVGIKKLKNPKQHFKTQKTRAEQR